MPEDGGSNYARILSRAAYRPMFAFSMLSGCAGGICNPAFNITRAEARAAIVQMQRNPRRLDRPVVIVGGFLDPNINACFEACFVRSIARDARVVPVSLLTSGSFENCRQRILTAVDKALPSNDPHWTAEVDVIGNSLGGLAAHYAATKSRDPSKPRRLRIARLYTISSPLRGARLAQRIALTKFHRDMIPGSPFLRQLAEEHADSAHTTVSYVNINDRTVGPENASLPGVPPYWLSEAWWMPPHTTAMRDLRIMADIGRRLRHEPPLSAASPADLPDRCRA